MELPITSSYLRTRFHCVHGTLLTHTLHSTRNAGISLTTKWTRITRPEVRYGSAGITHIQHREYFFQITTATRIPSSGSHISLLWLSTLELPMPGFSSGTIMQQENSAARSPFPLLRLRYRTKLSI